MVPMAGQWNQDPERKTASHPFKFLTTFPSTPPTGTSPRPTMHGIAEILLLRLIRVLDAAVAAAPLLRIVPLALLLTVVAA